MLIATIIMDTFIDFIVLVLFFFSLYEINEVFNWADTPKGYRERQEAYEKGIELFKQKMITPHFGILVALIYFAIRYLL